MSASTQNLGGTSKSLNSGRKLSVNQCQEQFEHRENFRFVPQEINPCIAAVVIDKSDKISVICMKNDRTNSLNITMNYLKRFCGSTACRRKLQNFTFAKFTCSTIKKHS